MIIKSFPDVIVLPTKKEVLRVHLYSKLVEKGIESSENDMKIIIELYNFGGYTNAERQEQFFDLCLENKYKKSKQSIRNTLSTYTNLGVFEKPKNTSLHVSEDYIPNAECDVLVLQHKVTHADRLQANL